MSKKYFDQGDFKKDTFFIDSTGARYELVKAYFVRNSLNPLRWFRSSPAIIVEIKVGPAIQLTLDEVKEIVISHVIRHRWFHQGSQSESEFRNMISNACNFINVINLISFYGKWQG